MEINSINDFKKNFYEIYHHDVLPMLKELESERVKKYNQARFWATLVFLVALGIVIWMWSIATGCLKHPSIFPFPPKAYNRFP